MEITEIEKEEFLSDLFKHKRKVLFELKNDLRYLETFKGHLIKEGSDDKARKRMAELKSKKTLTDVEEAELEQVLSFIKEVKNAVIEYEQTKKGLNNIEEYLTCLKSL